MQGPHTGDSAADTGELPFTPDGLLLVPLSKASCSGFRKVWQLMMHLADSAVCNDSNMCSS
jgi:hypothetical protein